MVQLVSVHVPKCAGTSFRLALEAVFGRDGVYRDYGPPVSNPECYRGDPQLLADKQVVHGHFHIRKYNWLGSSVQRVTFIRDPLQRLISHYFFWQTFEEPLDKLHQRFLETRMTILEFADVRRIANYCTEKFISDVDVPLLDFVGFHETYAEDLERLSKLSGVTFPNLRENVNRTDHYADRRKEVMADTVLVGKLRDLLKNEYQLYDKLKARFGH